MPLVFEPTIEPGRRCCFNSLVQTSFDFEVLDDRFDDQIAVFEFRQVVFEIADADERRAFRA